MKKIFDRKGVFVKSLSVWSAFATVATTSAPAFAAGTAVLGGSAQLSQLTRVTMDRNDPNVAVFSSTEASGVLDWSRFNIGLGQSMSFNGSGTTFFNLVDGAAGKSQIDGIIGGSGNVWVINPAGIAFGANASVNVGGLFAAAAGNLENAAALRDGTAMSPSFSSFAGTVDASKGTFTANQVALMGKTVTTAGGDFSRVKDLSVTATGGATEVDDVGGGKVSVNIRDFADDGAEVTLGDLNIDGDLSVKATGNVVTRAAQPEASAAKPMLQSVTKAGPVIQAGDIDIEAATDLAIDGELLSTAGHVDVLAYGKMDVNADVTAADYASLKAMGDVNVNADVAAGGNATIYSNNGSVTLEAGKTVSALGNVDITAGISDGAKGNVTINGNVGSSFGNVMLYSGYGDQSTGDVTINGNVTAEYGGIDAYAGFGYAQGTSGKLTVNGNLTGYASVSLKTGNGDIKVGENSVVSATGVGGEVDVYTAADAGYGLMAGEGHTGDIVVEGTLKAENAYGVVDVVAGKEIGATGAISFNGHASSDYITELATRTGKISVEGGEVSSLGNVMINNESGDIKIAQGASVIAQGGSQGQACDEDYGMPAMPSVMVLGAMNADGTSNVKIDGTVKAFGPNGGIDVKTGYDGNTAQYTGGKGNIDVNGSISAENHIGLTTLSGDVSLRGERVEIGAEMAITTRGEGSVAIEAEKGIAVDGDVVAAGDVMVTTKTGDIAINSDVLGDKVIVGSGVEFEYGEVYPGTGIYDFSPVSLAGDGTVSISGNIYGGSRVILGTDNGDIAIAKNSVVSTTDEKSEVDIDAGIRDGIDWTTFLPTEGGKGDVKIEGKISTGDNGITFINAGYGIGASGNIILDGTVEQAGSGQVVLNAGYGSGTGAEFGSQGGISGSGSIMSPASSLALTATDGIEVSGRVVAGAAEVSAGGDVRLENGKNDLGFVSASGSSVNLANANGLVLGDVTADGDLTVTAGGSIKQGEGTKIVANGQGAKVSLQAEGNVEITSVGNSFSEIAAKGADVKIRHAGDLTVDDVESTAGNVELFTYTGNLSIKEGAEIKAVGNVNLASGFANNQKGDVVINGKVSAAGENGVSVTAGLGTGSSGKVRVGKSAAIETTSEKGWVGIGANGTATDKGGVDIDGDVHANDYVQVQAVNGDIRIGSEAVISTAAKHGDRRSIRIATIDPDGVGGGITVDGKLVANGGGSAEVISETTDSNKGLTSTGTGDVTINGAILAGGTAFADAGYVDGTSGKLTVNGTMTGIEEVLLSTGNGAVEVNGAVSSDAGRVGVVSGLNDGGTGDLTINGAAKAKTDFVAFVSYGNGTKGDAVVNGYAEAGNMVAIETGDGAIRVAPNGVVRSTDANGQVFLQSSAHDMAQGGITVSGMVEASGKGGNVQLVSAMGERANGSVSVSGTVRASDSVHVLVGYGENSVGSASVDGGIVAGNVANVLTRTGAVAINGAVSGGRSVHVETGVDNGGSGDVVFGASGQIRAGENAEVRTSGGDVRQRGAVVNVDRSGFAEPKSLHAAVNAPNVGFSIRGDVGSGNSYVAVNGKTFAAVSGNASIAAANGSSFRGGVKPAHTPGVSVSVANIQLKEAGSSWTVDATPITQSIAHSIDWGGAGDNSSILANGDLSIYTAGALNPYGLLVAGRDLTVSAASFGDMSYLRAGGRLTVNNVGHPSHPQVAYFESVNGVEPNIENLPNDMVIFVDGRLAGGNLNILNKFGADEAFMVETPELKSTQGIFGNPPFLHSDLDVANPMEVSAIDYLIQEVPRLTLSSDFPADVDQNVEATGLSQKDVYWFGHKGADEKKVGETPDENTVEKEEKAEKPADANVAMAH